MTWRRALGLTVLVVRRAPIAIVSLICFAVYAVCVLPSIICFAIHSFLFGIAQAFCAPALVATYIYVYPHATFTFCAASFFICVVSDVRYAFRTQRTLQSAAQAVKWNPVYVCVYIYIYICIQGVDLYARTADAKS